MDKRDLLEHLFMQCRVAGLCRTQAEFAELIGSGRSVVSAALNGNDMYLTDNLIRKAQAYCDRYIGQKDDGSPAYTIPVIPESVRGGSLCELDEGHTEMECERIVSPVKGATMAMHIYGESMEPDYPSGALVLLKKIDPSVFIEWGCVYVLDTANGAVCKKVSKGTSEDTVLCESINPSFQSFEVPRSAIRGWWRVLMCMAMK